jgi:hypothetical protein
MLREIEDFEPDGGYWSYASGYASASRRGDSNLAQILAFEKATGDSTPVVGSDVLRVRVAPAVAFALYAFLKDA